MLSEARHMVESTWRAAESLDAKSSSLLATTAALAAASFAAIGFGVAECLPDLSFSAGLAMVPFVVGTILAAVASTGEKLNAIHFEGSAILKDHQSRKRIAQIESELAYFLDMHSNENDKQNGRRGRKITWSAYCVPTGIVVGASTWTVLAIL